MKLTLDHVQRVKLLGYKRFASQKGCLTIRPCLANSTSFLSGVSAGRFDSQYLDGSHAAVGHSTSSHCSA